MYYLRKFSNNSDQFKIKTSASKDYIEADIVSRELKTKNNSLSFWKFSSEKDKEDALLAIILSSSKIKTSRFFIVDDVILSKYGLKTSDSELGKTGYIGAEKLHVNIVDLNYKKLGDVLDMMRYITNRDELIIELEKEEIKAYIRKANANALIDIEKLDDKLKEDIIKYKL